MWLRSIAVEEWPILLNKSGRRSFLGNVDTFWQILRERDGLISVSQNTAKLISSLIALFFIFVCYVVFYLQVHNAIESRLLKIVGWFVAVCICSYFIIDLATIRKISWRKGGSYLEFKWGIYPFLKTIRLDPKGLTAELKDLPCKNIESSSKKLGLFLISPKPDMCDIYLARGKKIDFLLPTLDAISKFLEEIESQKST